MASHGGEPALSGRTPLPLVPLVLIHGAGGAGRLWQNQLLAFPRAVAPDLPGHPEGTGLSTVADMAGWVRRYVEERGLERVALAGHSLGAAVALQMALSVSGRLRGLILLGAGARLRVRPEFFDLIRADFNAAVGELLRWWFAPGTSSRIVGRARTALQAMPSAVVHDDFWAADHFDVMDRLDEIAVPTLIICGEEDRMTPLKYAEYLRDHIPGARLVVIPHAGHMAILEQPRAVNAAMAEFLRGLAPS